MPLRALQHVVFFNNLQVVFISPHLAQFHHTAWHNPDGINPQLESVNGEALRCVWVDIRGGGVPPPHKNKLEPVLVQYLPEPTLARLGFGLG